MENNIEKQYVVGVDIGGQTSKIGVVNTRGEVLSQLVIRSDIYGSDADAFILALSNAIKTCIKEAGVEVITPTAEALQEFIDADKAFQQKKIAEWGVEDIVSEALAYVEANAK